MPFLECCVFTRQGLELSLRLEKALKVKPWRAPAGEIFGACHFHAPERIVALNPDILPGAFMPFASIDGLMTRLHPQASAYLFIGAAGIAIRAMAPWLNHKSHDAPVVCMDANGAFAISLLSGHLGGANSLARHLAEITGALPVITTASDALDHNVEPLDELITQNGLKILDWSLMPRAMGYLLEGQILPLWDPWRAMPRAKGLERMPKGRFLAGLDMRKPRLMAHWRALPPADNILRLAVPRLHVGIGCRKNVAADQIEKGLLRILHFHGLEPRAIASIASIVEKRKQLEPVAARIDAPLTVFDAAELERVRTPNPSVFCGRRFAAGPFSVCESAAFIAAARQGPFTGRPFLLVPKTVMDRTMTFAVALAGLGMKK